MYPIHSWAVGFFASNCLLLLLQFFFLFLQMQSRGYSGNKKNKSTTTRHINPFRKPCDQNSFLFLSRRLEQGETHRAPKLKNHGTFPNNPKSLNWNSKTRPANTRHDRASTGETRVQSRGNNKLCVHSRTSSTTKLRGRGFFSLSLSTSSLW